MSEDDFVAAVTEGQPLRPQYFELDAQRNRELRPLLDDEPPAVLSLEEILGRHAAGAVLLDCREPSDFAAAHLRGAQNISLQGRFAEWAGDVVSPQRDIVLVGDPRPPPKRRSAWPESGTTESSVSSPIPERCSQGIRTASRRVHA